jgi:predicted HicB family RNase H-like nuclease
MVKHAKSAPEPSYSGKLNVRLGTDLHAALAAEAKSQGVSLNFLIVTLLAGGICWRRPAE